MNREEAIEIIKENWPPGQYTELRKALKLAMRVLSGEEIEYFGENDCPFCGTINNAHHSAACFDKQLQIL